MGKSAPKAPDPYQTAQAQAGANRATALTEQQINMVDQVNPWGSVTYSQVGQAFSPSTGIGSETYYYNPTTGEYRSSPPVGSPPQAGRGQSGPKSALEAVIFGGMPKNPAASSAAPQGVGEDWQKVQGILTPRYQQTTSLSPEQQAIFDQTQGAELNLATLAKNQSSFLNDYLAKPFEFSNQDAEQWAYDLGAERLDPRMAQQRATLETQLANQGIAPGSRAWETAMEQLSQAENDAYNQLMLTGRQQAFSENLATRNQPINEITALLSGSQVSNPATMSSPTPSTSVGGVDYSGLVNQEFQADTLNYQKQMGGLFGVAGAGLGAAGLAGGFGKLF